ncbi:MAG TPA: hypothetical protein VIA10_14095 [Gaiellaceae bacterium]|jgi:hypothetical protein
MRRLFLVLILTATGVGISTHAAEAAAPRIVIISGAPLRAQVVISDWRQIGTIVGEIAGARPAPRADLAHRPRMKVSMFWGSGWNDYLRSGKPASDLRPRDANQFGSVYPAWRGRPAMIDLPWAGNWPRPLSAKARTILRQNGIPMTLR